MLDAVFLIPAFPLVGFAAILVFGRRLGEPAAGWLATAAMGGSFAAAVVTFVGLVAEEAEEVAEDEWEYYYDDVEVKPKEQEQKEAPVPAPAPKKVDGWECPMCTLVNPLERPGCSACTTERPADLGAAAAADPVQETKETVKEDKKNGLEMYKQLENLDIIPNAENFECTICYLDVEPGDGVVLRECLHTFCK